MNKIHILLLKSFDLRLWLLFSMLLMNGYATPQGRKIESHSVVPIDSKFYDTCYAPTGEKGLCMYQYECMQSGGIAIALCKNGFQFGACCAHDRIINEVTQKPSTATPVTTSKTSTTTKIFKDSNVIDHHTTQECGLSSRIDAPFGRIVNGTRTYMGEFPWQASLMLFRGIGTGFEHYCGGVLLNHKWIATAAHCVARNLLVELRVRLGAYNLSFKDQRRPHKDFKIKRKVLHPNYKLYTDVFNLTYENDIALLELTESVKFKKHITPICLPGSRDLQAEHGAVVTGWGRTAKDAKPSEILQKVTLPILSNDECERQYSIAGFKQDIPDIFLCAGYKQGGHDACNGDSGGPLQTKSLDGRYVLSGLVSWGNGCGDRNKPGVYTRVSKFVPWILDAIA